MSVFVRRLDGSDVEPSGINFRRLVGVKANIRRGYQTEFAPYPSTDGKWLVRLIRPKRGNPADYKVDSYFEVIARNQDEAEAFIKKSKLWDDALMERIAHRIGKRGEAHAVARLAPGSQVVDASTGQTLVFDRVKQYQNASENGLDVLGRLARDAEPTPPPHEGDFMAFEVKATLGAADNPPGLSRDQRDAVTFTRSRLTSARAAEGSYPTLPSDDRSLIRAALRAIEGGKMHYRKVNIRMDHSGALASTGGKPAMELKSWP